MATADDSVAAARQRHLCHVFSTFARGGPQVRTANLINALGHRYRHTILAMDGDLACRDQVDAAVPVRFEQVPRRWRGLMASLPLTRWLRARRPDLLLTYNWGALDAVIAARAIGLGRVVHAEEGFNPDERVRQKRRRILLRRVLLKSISAVVVPSESLLSLALLSWRLPPTMVRYIPNGVDVDHFSPAAAPELRHALGVSPDSLLLGMVGNLAGSKNVGLSIRALAASPELHSAVLLVVGGGPQRQELQALAQQLGVEKRVLFAGQVSDPLQHYRAMDVFLLASDTEQMPVALLEAMSVGLPVVATDVGDVRRMLPERNLPYVVAAGDLVAFAAALQRMTMSASERSQLGASNRDRCRQLYDHRNTWQQYSRLYEQALATVKEGGKSLVEATQARNRLQSL